MNEKNLKEVSYEIVKGQRATAVLTFEDDSKKYIFVECGMIFVADCDYEALTKLALDDDIDSFEAYDITDCCDYYMSSEYASEINSLLLKIVNDWV